jgi:DNA polymerase delta subunit 1
LIRLSISAGSYRVRPEFEKISRCQLELDCDYRAIVSHDSVGEWLKIAPLRVLSFDIECAGRKGHFPKPEIDPVIQIACCLSTQDNLAQPISKAIFTLNSCASIVGTTVISNRTEQELLLNFLKFFLTTDPDIITGYNIINFDFPYILDRAKALKVTNFPYLGRILTSVTTMKNAKFESKAYGIRENKEIKIEGRIQFDLLDVMRREFKLRSYTLNAVCAHFLQQQKEDVHYSIITDLQNGTDETRRRLAIYCIKDSLLPLQLMDKLMLIINYIEMARVTGVPITYLLTRGQQIKVISQLYRKSKQRNLLIPVRQIKKEDEKYEGATVIEPKKGYYTLPIATLDFASLYPSIMQAHNLCYSTLLSPQHLSKLSKDDYVRTPTGDCFIKPSIQRGLLPEILSELLEARSAAKKQMKSAKDAFTAAVLNGRQLALKISANSVYGFTGAQVGQLPCLAISSSVTAFGRDMIQHTKAAVEKHYTISNGYKYNAEIIYGDTDSVMVKFGCSSVEEAMKLGAEAAGFVTKEFVDPIKLEFEKVYWPYLLMNKKRYAGLYWTNADKWDKMDTKGIETVRRDNCQLVSQVVTECLNLILIERNVPRAIDYAKRVISDLLTNRLDLSLLVISKSLGKSASSEGYTAKQAHVELAERMRKRDPRSAPVVGDRVAYVITRGAKGAPAYDKAEDPIYVLEHDIPIDTHYYLQNQLTQPLTRLFEPILQEKSSSLFTGDHTRHIKIATANTSGGIMQFAVKKRTCLACKVPLLNHDTVVCSSCHGREAELYLKAIENVREHEELYSQAWTTCQRCTNILHQDVLCTSKDCPIFYRRKKVQKDLKEAQASLDRFTF